MPRKHARKSALKRRDLNAGHTVREVGQVTDLYAYTGVTGFSLNPLNASLGVHLNTLAGCFEEYRFVELEVVMQPGGSASTTLAVGYSPQYLSTAGGSLADVAQLQNSVVRSSAATVPTRLWMGRRDLISSGMFKWWRCVDTADSDFIEVNQGQVFFFSTVASNIVTTLRYAIEFRGIRVPTELFLKQLSQRVGAVHNQPHLVLTSGDDQADAGDEKQEQPDSPFVEAEVADLSAVPHALMPAVPVAPKVHHADDLPRAMRLALPAVRSLVRSASVVPKLMHSTPAGVVAK